MSNLEHVSWIRLANSPHEYYSCGELASPGNMFKFQEAPIDILQVNPCVIAWFEELACPGNLFPVNHSKKIQVNP